jgi:hypothetical protein
VDFGSGYTKDRCRALRISFSQSIEQLSLLTDASGMPMDATYLSGLKAGKLFGGKR